MKVKKIITEAKLTATQSIEDCQTLLDTDLDRYGFISTNTLRIISDAGFALLDDGEGGCKVVDRQGHIEEEQHLSLPEDDFNEDDDEGWEIDTSIDDEDDDDDDEYYKELEKHINELPDYSDKDLVKDYKDFKGSTHPDDKKVEDAIKAEMRKRGIYPFGTKRVRESLIKNEALDLPVTADNVYDRLLDVARKKLETTDNVDNVITTTIREELWDENDIVALADRYGVEIDRLALKKQYVDDLKAELKKDLQNK